METIDRTASVEHLVSLAVFARVVETRSVSRAADALGISKSMVSKRLARLESDLRVRLVRRTTRRIAVTEAGVALYERAARMLAAAEDARAAIADVAGRVQGRLRVNAPVSFGQMHVAPAIPAFLAEHPDVQVELTVSDQFVDIVSDGYDIVLRITRLADSSLVARKLGNDARVVVAAPSYLARHGTPRTLDDLLQHNCLRYAYLPLRDEWRFRTARGHRSVPVTGNFVGNNGTLLREAAVGGLGIALLPMHMVERELEAGTLRVILEHASVEPLGIWAIHAYASGVPAKVRAFIDFLAARLRARRA
jgi:DNA-binding transcriptional LysR family regulator